MHSRLLFSAATIIGLAASFLTAPTAYSGAPVELAGSPPRLEQAPITTPVFELSLGYNYIYQGDLAPETKHLHGGDLSAFVNVASWLGLGGDFMANFGERTQRFFFGDLNIESQRYVYVFGPRITVWRDEDFRIFVEALAGGVHAEAKASVNLFNRTASEDAFAMAVGAGVDCRITRHFSWRIIQGDYLPTHLGSNWQNNLKASTGFVLTFGGK